MDYDPSQLMVPAFFPFRDRLSALGPVEAGRIRQGLGEKLRPAAEQVGTAIDGRGDEKLPSAAAAPCNVRQPGIGASKRMAVARQDAFIHLYFALVIVARCEK
ncbi:hypothetical protein [Paracoccus sp. ME4]|uniref:hypothetical protein n=1 Tax=Paracoccus sp. ME4 TaxID=3138066 RepID=UPI00398AD35E